MFNIEFLSKENIAIIGVVILFLWRIIDVIIRTVKKRQYEVEKLAFEMAKIKSSYDEHDPQNRDAIITYYFHCLDALKNRSRKPEYYYNWLKSKESEIDRDILNFRNVVKKWIAQKKN